jgi:hypothetical protein
VATAGQLGAALDRGALQPRRLTELELVADRRLSVGRGTAKRRADVRRHRPYVEAEFSCE